MKRELLTAALLAMLVAGVGVGMQSPVTAQQFRDQPGRSALFSDAEWAQVQASQTGLANAAIEQRSTLLAEAEAQLLQIAARHPDSVGYRNIIASRETDPQGYAAYLLSQIHSTPTYTRLQDSAAEALPLQLRHSVTGEQMVISDAQIDALVAARLSQAASQVNPLNTVDVQRAQYFTAEHFLEGVLETNPELRERMLASIARVSADGRFPGGALLAKYTPEIVPTTGRPPGTDGDRLYADLTTVLLRFPTGSPDLNARRLEAYIAQSGVDPDTAKAVLARLGTDFMRDARGIVDRASLSALVASLSAVTDLIDSTSRSGPATITSTTASFRAGRTASSLGPPASGGGGSDYRAG